MCIVPKFWFHFALLAFYLLSIEYPYCLCSIYIFLVVSDILQQQIIHVINKKNP